MGRCMRGTLLQNHYWFRVEVTNEVAKFADDSKLFWMVKPEHIINSSKIYVQTEAKKQTLRHLMNYLLLSPQQMLMILGSFDTFTHKWMYQIASNSCFTLVYAQHDKHTWAKCPRGVWCLRWRSNWCRKGSTTLLCQPFIPPKSHST